MITLHLTHLQAAWVGFALVYTTYRALVRPACLWLKKHLTRSR